MRLQESAPLRLQTNPGPHYDNTALEHLSYSYKVWQPQKLVEIPPNAVAQFRVQESRKAQFRVQEKGFITPKMWSGTQFRPQEKQL